MTDEQGFVDGGLCLANPDNFGKFWLLYSPKLSGTCQESHYTMNSPMFSGADGGGRTHTPFRIPDFESSASANSATSATRQTLYFMRA